MNGVLFKDPRSCIDGATPVHSLRSVLLCCIRMRAMLGKELKTATPTASYAGCYVPTLIRSTPLSNGIDRVGRSLRTAQASATSCT
jgi:hypothetical protein